MVLVVLTIWPKQTEGKTMVVLISSKYNGALMSKAFRVLVWFWKIKLLFYKLSDRSEFTLSYA